MLKIILKNIYDVYNSRKFLIKKNEIAFTKEIGELITRKK